MHARAIDRRQSNETGLVLGSNWNRIGRNTGFVCDGGAQADKRGGHILFQRIADLNRLPSCARDREAQQFLDERGERKRPRPLGPVGVERTGKDDDSAAVSRPLDDGRVERLSFRASFGWEEVEYTSGWPSRGEV